MPSYGKPLNDPINNPALIQLKAMRNQQSTQLNNQMEQDRLRREEAENNQLTAQRMALDNSAQLQAGPNPRTVTDTSMTISNAGGTGSSTGSRSSALSGLSGAGRQLPPDLAGRFMPLIEMGQPQLGAAKQPKEAMPAADFSPIDATAHQNAAFARTKDRAGQLGQGALQTLASQLAGRGISGPSGTFGRGLADIVSSSVQPLADLNVAHLGEEYEAANRARALSEARAGTEFSGNITQRGQDIQTQQAIDALLAALEQTKFQGGISQRGQDLEMLARLGLL